MPSWSKLTERLREQGGDLTLSFREIERVIGGPLPASAHNHAAFWSNSIRNNYSKIWRDAGFGVTRRGLGPDKICFERVGAGGGSTAQSEMPTRQHSKAPATPPDLILVGCVATKANRALPARDLYISELFNRRRHYAEKSGVPWVILSASSRGRRP